MTLVAAAVVAAFCWQNFAFFVRRRNSAASFVPSPTAFASDDEFPISGKTTESLEISLEMGYRKMREEELK